MARFTIKIRDQAISAARRYEILPSHLVGLWKVESGFDPLAMGGLNKEGAPYTFGLGQVDIRGAGKGQDPRRLLDPEVNADISARYLGECFDKCSGDIGEGIAAYRFGVLAVTEHGVKKYQKYVESVLLAVAEYTDLDDASKFPTPARTHKITRSQSLLGLSMLYYGNPTRWADIYAANMESVGPDPSQVKAGTILTIP